MDYSTELKKFISEKFWNFIISHPEKAWIWINISENSCITLNDILSHPEIGWNWNWISKNPNITIDYILSHPEKMWNWWHCMLASAARLHLVGFFVFTGLFLVGLTVGLVMSLKFTLNVMVSPEALILLMVIPVSRIIPPW